MEEISKTRREGKGRGSAPMGCNKMYDVINENAYESKCSYAVFLFRWLRLARPGTVWQLLLEYIYFYSAPALGRPASLIAVSSLLFFPCSSGFAFNFIYYTYIILLPLSRLFFPNHLSRLHGLSTQKVVSCILTSPVPSLHRFERGRLSICMYAL